MKVLTNFQTNDENMGEELKFIEEFISEAALKEAAIKQKIANHHNKKVVTCEFNVGDLILR